MFNFMPYILFILLFPLFALGPITTLIPSLSSTMNCKSPTLDHTETLPNVFPGQFSPCFHFDVEMAINYSPHLYLS